jgi:hypothetical protein
MMGRGEEERVGIGDRWGREGRRKRMGDKYPDGI